MVPSLLAKEPRRSARRPLHTPTSSTSLSPTSAVHFPPPPDPTTPPAPSSNLPPSSTSKRAAANGKRVKQEPDDPISAHPARHSMDDPGTTTTINGRAKRKSKDTKVELVVPSKLIPDPPTHEIAAPNADDENDDDGGITRCVCGRTDVEEDEEGYGLMVMCETCSVWQHAICVNLSADQAEQDYYCEQCRPDLHPDLIKPTKKRARQQAGHNRRASASVPRSSRSHSPGHILGGPKSAPPKRRNTMNSRDADYEESVKQLIESTRPEADRNGDESHDKDDQTPFGETPVIVEIVSGARKKRKRAAAENDQKSNNTEKEEPSVPNKRQRSHSTNPDEHTVSTASTNLTMNSATTNGAGPGSRQPSTSSGAGGKQSIASGSSTKKRGRKENAPSGEGTDASSKKHPNQYTYRKPVAPTPPKRPGLNGALSASHQTSSSNPNEHGTRRNAHDTPIPGGPQPLLTSWGLPDYLAHLASELPSDVPHPVEVRVLDTTSAQENGTNPTENGKTTSVPAEDNTVLERGVKVKWPAKRISVSDMNKRVRGIIDWVGREQASALDRRRRREALRASLKEEAARMQGQESALRIDPMLLEPLPESEATHQMEELMKEMIAFQERFGPGSKGRERKAVS
ncbi:hypothetical protein M422DRAFT_27915 [Sphaerobolus stellatus SS14]|nr:hypothetical protein M422DRAFT_27915 [Sphaerobolus stellatus SS14]